MAIIWSFFNGAMMIMVSVVIVAYLFYTISTEIIQKVHSDYLYLTTLFVILGILRYFQIVFVKNNRGSPTQIVLKDTFMQLNILRSALAFFWIYL